MVKRFFITVLLLVGFQGLETFPTKLFAQAPDTLWTKTYGGSSYDYGNSVQECASGGFIIAGATRSFGAGGYDVYLIRTNSDGDTLWTKTYGGTDDDYGKSVQECTEGGFIIAGRTGSFGAGENDVWLIRTDTDGDTLWTKTYGGTISDYGYSVEECVSGGFIIAGWTWSFGAGSGDVYLIRTNANGDTLWTKTYGGTRCDGGNSVQECAGGGFIIAGETFSFGAGFYDVWLIRTDADGDSLWTKTYGGTDFECGRSVQECASRGFIIAGLTVSFGADSGDVYLIRISDAGVEEETGNRHKAIGISLEVYPNPVVGSGIIRYELPDEPTTRNSQLTTLKVYDLGGRLVKTLVDGEVGAGHHEIELMGGHDKSCPYKKGIYFIQLKSGRFKTTQKFIILE